jgi:malate dehydrogenase (oxaloacetate-decarboxylating)
MTTFNHPTVGLGRRAMLVTELEGEQLLTNPALNAGTAFTDEEREEFGLHGLLPPIVETLEQQSARAYEAYKRKTEDLERHIYLRALQDTNETLFYALLVRHITEMAPIIYTPVVAQGCINFSQIYRRPRGLFLSYPLAARMDDIIDNRPNRDVDVIVVTDGERILGIGDQGAGGLGIPIGKLALYTLLGGVHPWRTLPILLDVGTNNAERLHDPAYLGWRHERISGQPYWDFIEEFIRAIERKLPGVLLQWEDFSKWHARPILDKYRDRLCTFNDDIQGTAAVTLGTLYAALNVTGKRLGEHQIVIAGAGSAGIGIADFFVTAMAAEGLPEPEARKRIYLLNRDGVLHTGMKGLSAEQQKFTHPVERFSAWQKDGQGRISLDEVVRRVDTTVLVGLTTQPGLFSEAIVREMARKVERPIIFPLSNPADRCEAKPSDLIEWTEGRALVATGTAFNPVPYKGRAIHIAQCNNCYVFPSVGLALVASGARRVTDAMMLAAARSLGDHSPALKDPSAPLLPSLEDVPALSCDMALAIATEAGRSGVAPQTSPEELRKKIEEAFWTPAYPVYRRRTSA